ncbi:hypothetical protein BABINDRAFT_160082 [Babjeviella inositovora NRRL Y-12698]|uniref:DNA replication licensing factor MCM2 n=1 Tax=Babjeviella inositovora NRRL Y-12698 TaxID=984486 RepID=A0A1E3QXR1_9ASCO|nr:uncharacterized protein BABINDRAFT_160082 [Babjeviella inositovora NRRL Y-12698]ODQ81852.1 hypothetical protein BABINDRAFT_160082 [Babjeviella inositovora NRRL Y-12698]
MSNPRKRQADEDEDETMGFAGSSSPAGTPLNSSPQLPPSSPAIPFEDDEREIRDFDIDELEDAEDEDGVDLIGDDMMRDYRPNTAEDHYDAGNLDDEEYEELGAAERRAVDARLDRRDDLMRGSTRDRAFLDDGARDGEVDEYGLPVQPARRRTTRFDEDEDLAAEDHDPLSEEFSLEALADVKALSIPAWIAQAAVARSIARELRSFLLEYTDEEGRSVYGARIRHLGEVNSESLEVSYSHLAESKAILAMFLAVCPAEMLKIFDVVAMDATELHYPEYSHIHAEIHVRITDFLEVTNLRDLRENNLNTMVRISGVVTRRTGVFPQLKYVKFDCLKCGAVIGPFLQESDSEVRVSMCLNCQARGPFRMNTEKTLYRNYQRVTLQEAPGTVPAGRLPRHREVILLWDLVDVAKPGEEVEITGIYKNSYDGSLNAKNGFPVFATVLEANAVKRRDGAGLDAFAWTEDEERAFAKFARERGAIDKIVASMAPSIYGHTDIKTAVACSLFGGVPKDVNGKHNIRGDINVLLLGDPGTAKSQILKYIEKTAHRAVFATGQGASAVGLTASVRKDPITREWTLEGGALVLADKGTCLIDEFDKMNDKDRTSIHEAMEQQSISISKAGIVTTLQARCAIIAAANPNGGRYNSTLPLSQNVDLTEPILSRFDILCVVRDTVDPESDERLAGFVLDSHMRSHPAEDTRADAEDIDDTRSNTAEAVRARARRIAQANQAKEQEISPLSQEFLTKYIHYARAKIHPKLHQMDMDKVARVYADLRRESISTGSFPITVRHLESILRIAEAFAKMRLSEFVSPHDLNKAIQVSVESFVGAQKVSVRKQLQRSFMKYTLPSRERASASA